MELKLTPATFLGIYLDFEFSDLKTTINPDNLSKNSSTNSVSNLERKNTGKFKLEYGVWKSRWKQINVYILGFQEHINQYPPLTN